MRNQNSVPMSIRNEDRHGLKNLTHDPVKVLDRLHIPPYIIYGFLFILMGGIIVQQNNNEELDIEALQRRNLLLSMKKS